MVMIEPPSCGPNDGEICEILGLRRGSATRVSRPHGTRRRARAHQGRQDGRGVAGAAHLRSANQVAGRHGLGAPSTYIMMLLLSTVPGTSTSAGVTARKAQDEYEGQQSELESCW